MASGDYDLPVLLEWLEMEADLIWPLNSEVQNIRLKMNLLSVFVTHSGKWYIEDGNIKALFTRILTVYGDAFFGLRRIDADLDRLSDGDWIMPIYMDGLLSGILQRLQLLTPDIQQVYTLLSKSPRSIYELNFVAISYNLDFLAKTIVDLLILDVELGFLVKEELQALAKCLRLFRGFLWLTAKLCRDLRELKDLLVHAEIVIDNISCLVFLCSDHEKMNDEMVKELKVQLSSELHKISPTKLKVMKIQPEVGKNYVKALEMLKSELGILDLHYLDSLFDYVMRISETKLSFMTSNKSLYEEVRFLTKFFLGAEDESRVHDQMGNYLLRRIKALIIESLCAIVYSLHNNEQSRDEARGIRMAVYDLQHIFMLKRENATKADYIYLRMPWRFLRPNNAWREISFHLYYLEQQLEDKLIYPLAYQIGPVREELLLLMKAFNEFTATQSHLDKELEIQRRRLIHIVDCLNHVITSFKYRVVTLWSCKLELYYGIQNIKMIKMEVRDVINRFTDDAESIDNEQLSSGSKMLRILSIVGMLEVEDQLKCLETDMDLISPLKDVVQTLRLKASFLRVFLSCRGKWHSGDGNLKVILTRIQTVSQNMDLQKLWANFVLTESIGCLAMPMNMEHTLSSMQERLQLLNSDIHEVYTVLSKSSRFITSMTDRTVMASLNSLLENIEDLRFNVQLVSHVKDELEAVEKCLRFLADFLCFIAKRCSELGKLKDLLIHAETLVDNISCLLYLCFTNDDLNDQMVKEMKMQLSSELHKFSLAQPEVRQIYIKTLRATTAQATSSLVYEFDWGFLDSLQGYILELSDTKTWSTMPIRDQILLLWEDLPLLITYFGMALSPGEHIEDDHQIFKDLLGRTCSLILEIRCFVGMHQNDEQNDVYKKFSDFLARKSYEFYFPRSFRLNIPRTIGSGFIGSVLGTLKELLNTKADLVAPLKHQLEIVQEELLFVREDFSTTVKQPSQHEELQSLWIRFTNTVYRIEYVIDSFLAGQVTFSCHKLVLFNVIEEIKTMKLELQAIKNKNTHDKLVPKLTYLSSKFSTKVDLSKVNAVLNSKLRLAEENYTSELVIFPEAEEEIMEQLRYGTRKLDFLSIVGMPGIGKTTLANSVFQHSLVASHFHVRARCSVSQVYDKRRLLREILQQVTTESNQCSDNDDVEKRLYQSLKGRRYLIFMDDIWSVRPWEEIRNSFPNDDNGSRILFTSRFDYTSLQSGTETLNYALSPLSEEKSWKMLESKIFGGGSCPTYLVNLGREIAANCKGLPLTVDLVAGILRGKETRWQWKKVAESMMEYLFDDPQGRCQKVLELSYKNLPDELKPCFLYFTAFPEDTDIPKKELMLLWIAEGFVQLQKDDLCLEDAAEKILNNLIGGSLVTVSKRRCLGGVKTTRIHDLLHNFASAKAKEERFMLKIDYKANFSTSDGHLLPKQYRLSIYPGNWDQFLESNPSGNCARALISSRSPFRSSKPLQFSCFNLLRVLYIPHVTFRHHPTMIFTLIHLRFLAISGSESKILSEIHKLWNLETFIVENLFPFGCLFLDEFCNMMRLGHFCSQDYVYIFYVEYHRGNILEKSFLFDNLRTLYHVQMSYADVEKILKLMPNLVKLKVKFYNPDGSYYPFPKLDFLEKLESLKVTHDWTEHPCKIIHFPPYLKTLVLSHFCVPWTEISEIGNFEYLEILKLKNGAFKGAVWDMIDGQFPALKYLSLSNLDIEEWNAMEDHLSRLEQLHVDSCRELKELPVCLAEVATLQKINLYYCRSSAKRSAERIKEEQIETGNDQLVVNMKDFWR